ncbi:MAG: hypothetical protein M0Q94_16555, partial [Candidatus Cloacimonetes bacterium]|nr:hypothetical protein [Candidatus Cloacimonadota bacterium]
WDWGKSTIRKNASCARNAHNIFYRLILSSASAIFFSNCVPVIAPSSGDNCFPFRNSQQLNQAMRMIRNGTAWSRMAPHGGTDRCAWTAMERHGQASAQWKKEAEPS